MKTLPRSTGGGLPRVDVICGGFPCQDISSAGKGAGLSGARSGLWYEYLRIIREHAPDFVLIENVASGAKRWVDFVRSDLGRAGYQSIPVPLSAFDVGAPHLRERIFIVAHANSVNVRFQPGRGIGAYGSDPHVAGYAGPDRESSFTHAHVQGRGFGGAGGTESQDGPSSSTGEVWPSEASDPSRGRWQAGTGAAERDHGQASSGRACDAGRVHPGTPSAVGDTHGHGQPADAIDGEVAELCGLASDSSPWAFAPEFRGMDDGVPVRLDNRSKRLKALGNAVVPQCAEVMGYIIQLMAGPAVETSDPRREPPSVEFGQGDTSGR